MSINSAKGLAMDALWNTEESIAKVLQPEEETFVEAAMQLAEANPESIELHRLAVRAILRVRRLSQVITGAEIVDVNPRWEAFLKSNARTSAIPWIENPDAKDKVQHFRLFS